MPMMGGMPGMEGMDMGAMGGMAGMGMEGLGGGMNFPGMAKKNASGRPINIPGVGDPTPGTYTDRLAKKA